MYVTTELLDYSVQNYHLPCCLSHLSQIMSGAILTFFSMCQTAQPCKESWVYEIEPVLLGKVGPDLRLQPQVDPARGAQARGLEIFTVSCLTQRNVGAGIHLEHRITLSSDIMTHKCSTLFSKRNATLKYVHFRWCGWDTDPDIGS